MRPEKMSPRLQLRNADVAVRTPAPVSFSFPALGVDGTRRETLRPNGCRLLPAPEIRKAIKLGADVRDKEFRHA
jgi:hypothetical protein